VRKFGKPSVRGPDGRPVTAPGLAEDLRKILPPRELGMYLSIEGHFHEVCGRTGEAIGSYRKAIIADPENPDYNADLERYVTRHARDGNAPPRSEDRIEVQEQAEAGYTSSRLERPSYGTRNAIVTAASGSAHTNQVSFSGNLLPSIAAITLKEKGHV
jgi:hypothetical protein